MNALHVQPMANQYKVNSQGMITDFYGSYAGTINQLGNVRIHGNEYFNKVDHFNNNLYDNLNKPLVKLNGLDSFNQTQKNYYDPIENKMDFCNSYKPIDTYNLLNKSNNYDDLEEDNKFNNYLPYNNLINPGGFDDDDKYVSSYKKELW